MRNKFLLLGAASLMMLAACSEDINQGPDNNKPVENALNLTSLSPASQAGRVSLPGQTRGQKSDRLQLVAKIAPVASAQDNNWSATGIAIANGNAYVSWHSNRQAQNQATAWGGAIDVLRINALAGMEGAIDPEGVFESTQVSSSAKFNGIVDGGTAFYLPITSYNYGAAVGRWVPGTQVVDTIVIPGVSANSIAVRGSDIYAVSGYKGGLYSFPAANFGAETRTAITEHIAYSETFGGKYIDGDYVLRTDDEGMEILPIAGGNARYIGAPLKSQSKQAETYDPESGKWTLVDGTAATHYGKHTMAVDGSVTYVGGGIAEGGENGLRVYAGTSTWSNGTSTTAVCVANVDAQKFVFAATDAGLRVYEPYANGELPLFAFEVYNYDDKGNAMGGGLDTPSAEAKPVAGTTGHSANFVAVDSATGLIFVATGQTGVYVFKLDTTVPANPVNVSLSIPSVGYDETKTVEEGDEGADFTIPEGPADNDEGYFAGYTDEENGTEPKEEYDPGKTITLTPEGGDKILYPVYKPYAFTVNFYGNKPAGVTGDVQGVPEPVRSKEATSNIPDVKPTLYGKVFAGWSTDPNANPALIAVGALDVLDPGDAVTSEMATDKVLNLYALWLTDSSAEGNQGGNNEPEPEPEPEPEQGGGGHDPNEGGM